MFETGPKKSVKRTKVKGGDASDLDGFLGPWAKYQDEKDGAKPSEVRPGPQGSIYILDAVRAKWSYSLPYERSFSLRTNDIHQNAPRRSNFLYRGGGGQALIRHRFACSVPHQVSSL